MTKQEVLAKLAAKMQANRDEVRDQLEFLAELPGHVVHFENVDLLHRLSVTWKEGQALREVANELVGLVYQEGQPLPPEARPS